MVPPEYYIQRASGSKRCGLSFVVLGSPETSETSRGTSILGGPLRKVSPIITNKYNHNQQHAAIYTNKWEDRSVIHEIEESMRDIYVRMAILEQKLMFDAKGRTPRFW